MKPRFAKKNCSSSICYIQSFSKIMKWLCVESNDYSKLNIKLIAVWLYLVPFRKASSSTSKAFYAIAVLVHKSALFFATFLWHEIKYSHSRNRLWPLMALFVVRRGNCKTIIYFAALVAFVSCYSLRLLLKAVPLYRFQLGYILITSSSHHVSLDSSQQIFWKLLMRKKKSVVLTEPQSWQWLKIAKLYMTLKLKQHNLFCRIMSYRMNLDHTKIIFHLISILLKVYNTWIK